MAHYVACPFVVHYVACLFVVACTSLFRRNLCFKTLTAGVDLGLDPVDQSVEYGVKHCQEMAAVLSRLLSDGKKNSLYGCCVSVHWNCCLNFIE